MPTYEYRCEKCAYEFEALQKMSDDPLKSCPNCGKDALIKLISRSSFQLKGSGWYQTDFKNPAEKKEPKTETTKKKEDNT